MSEVYIKVDTDEFIYFVSAYAYPRFLEDRQSNLHLMANADMVIRKSNGKVIKCRWGPISV